MVIRELITQLGFKVNRSDISEANSAINSLKMQMSQAGDTGRTAGTRGSEGMSKLGSAAKTAGSDTKSAGDRGSEGLSKLGLTAKETEIKTRELGLEAKKLHGEFNNSSESAVSGMGRVGSSIGSLISRLGPLATAIGAAFSIEKIKDTADEMMNLDGRLRTITKSDEERYAVEDQLHSLAQQNRQDLNSMGDLYFKVARGAQRYGFDAAQSMRVTDIVSKALTVGGASATEAKASILQLGQALSSGVLQGDELHSLDENASLLMQHIADNLGVSIGQLKQLGRDGDLTSEVVIKAILASGDAIDAEMGKMPTTIGQAITTIGNAWDFMIMKIERRSHIFGTIAQNIANNLLFVEKAVGYLTYSSDDEKPKEGESSEDTSQRVSKQQSDNSNLEAQVPALATIKQFLGEVQEYWITISGYISQAIAVISPMVTETMQVASAFGQAFSKLISFDTIVNIAKAIGTGLMAVWQIILWIVEAVTWFINNFTFLAEIIAIVGGVILAALYAPILVVLAIIGLLAMFVQWVCDGIIDAFNSVGEWVGQVWQDIKDKASSFCDFIVAAISVAAAILKDVFGAFGSYAESIIKGIADAITKWIGEKIQWAQGKLSELQGFVSKLTGDLGNAAVQIHNANQTNNVTVSSVEEAEQYQSYVGDDIYMYD